MTKLSRARLIKLLEKDVLFFFVSFQIATKLKEWYLNMIFLLSYKYLGSYILKYLNIIQNCSIVTYI